MRLPNKVAVITGAGSGMGRAASLRFSKEGAKIVAAEVNEASGAKTVADIREGGGQAVFVKTDVSKAEDCRRMVQTAIDSFGRIDILLNIAGLSGGSFRQAGMSEEEVWDKVIGINLKGTHFGCRYAIPEMAKRGGGAIVNIASTAGIVGSGRPPTLAGTPATTFNTAFNAYGPSKAGVAGLTRGLAIANAKDKIRVNAVAPGVVISNFFTPQDPGWWGTQAERFPLGRVGTPEDIANACLFLASDDASWITGHQLVVDGGFTVQ